MEQNILLYLLSKEPLSPMLDALLYAFHTNQAKKAS